MPSSLCRKRQRKNNTSHLIRFVLVLWSVIQGPSKKGILLNVGQLAGRLGVSPCFVKRMKWAGFPMPGGRSTVIWALRWLERHPDFRQADWIRPRRGGERPPGKDADK
jgi:hypothetical protein